MGDFSDLTMIIPTLNEAGNIRKVVSLVLAHYKGVRILVVDDGSTDGTARAVRALSRGHREVRFLDRRSEREHGITASVIDAAKYVTTKKIVVMDADLQHPVDKVAAIAHALDQNDIVVGVRTAVKDWGFHRRVLSKGIAYFSYTVFRIRGLPTTRDMMSGFFGIRSSLLKRAARERKRFVLEGYKVLLDLMRISGRGLRIGEIEYDTFGERKAGRSKLKARHMAQTILSTLKA